MPKKISDEEARKTPINVRMLPDLRSKLETAAEVAGRSLTQEAEMRLVQSFEPYYGALAEAVSLEKKSGRVLRALADLFKVVSFDESGTPSYLARAALSAAFSEILQEHYPKPAGLMADIFHPEDDAAKEKAEERFRQVAGQVLQAQRVQIYGDPEGAPGMTLVQMAMVLGLLPSDGKEATRVLEEAAKAAGQKKSATAK